MLQDQIALRLANEAYVDLSLDLKKGSMTVLNTYYYCQEPRRCHVETYKGQWEVPY